LNAWPESALMFLYSPVFTRAPHAASVACCVQARRHIWHSSCRCSTGRRRFHVDQTEVATEAENMSTRFPSPATNGNDSSRSSEVIQGHRPWWQSKAHYTPSY